MENRYQELLIEWCDALVGSQITDEADEYYGGFRCDSCGFAHGRADNAIYPLVCAYDITDNKAYLSAAERLLSFRKKLTEPDGAVKNDFSSDWRGITSFSAIGLLKALAFEDILPPAFKKEVERCAKSAAHWVHENMVIGFPAYINYYCAASLANALYAERYDDEDYRNRAKQLLDYCLKLFTPNGLLAGEGKPHDDTSPKGCLPIDIGYIAEESLPCLLHAAQLLGDDEALSALSEHARKLLAFFLPDGGWDNSFGVRNNKWTYYGSRTSDGCIGAFALLAKRDARFAGAAERTYDILKRCTTGGKLYGGPHYAENGQKPCIHHTFCHASALADAIRIGLPERALPLSDWQGIGYRYYPELNTYLIHAGSYRATLTGYDYATHNYYKGAAHAGGGTLSLLYKEGTGAMIAGSVYDYLLTEPNNMQTPVGEKKHSSLLLRAEYEKDGIKYATCLDRDPEITIREEAEGVTMQVRSRFFSAKEPRAQDPSLIAEFTYRFTPEGVRIKVGKLPVPATFILPVIENSGEVITNCHYSKQPIFFLTGGFAADEYTFSLAEEVEVTIQ